MVEGAKGADEHSWKETERWDRWRSLRRTGARMGDLSVWILFDPQAALPSSGLL